jgi:hypothetical protein
MMRGDPPSARFIGGQRGIYAMIVGELEFL